MKKTRRKKVLLILIILVAIFALYNLSQIFFSGKQTIKVAINEKYYAGNNIQSIIEVRKSKNNNLIKSKLKVVLKDENNKTVKGTKENYKIEEGEIGNVDIKVPEDIEPGKYSLKVTSTSNFLKDTVEIPLLIENERNANISIFLDKGIYKPGDELNYRVLITGVKDDKPIEEDVNVYIFDGNGNKVYSEYTTTSEYGIISGNFILASEVNSGDYKITVERANSEVSKTFKVNPYITPKFEAQITGNKDNFLVGENVEMTLSANYFFGEPVKNATVKGKIGEKEINGLTDESGKFVFTTTAEEVGSIAANLEVIDTSNYSVETSKIVYVATDVFEIEILPEYGKIIKDIDNEIYIITKKIDGTPIKTYGDIKIGNISRQLITDESGIGKILLTSSDLEEISTKRTSSKNNSSYYGNYVSSKYSNVTEMSLSLENMNGEKVSTVKEINVESLAGTVLKTDKVKYNVGEDITTYLKSNNDSSQKYISIYKGEELLNLISTDNEEVKFNLGDTYGIIDIYVSEQKSNRYSINGLENKKTIFIKPDKALTIDVKTNKTEYEPKENLEITFETKDASNENVDSALLVSILDEAVLSLAENDLSIDNIKLALSNVKLTDNMTAADVYASAIDEKSETKFMSILLKQDTKNENVSINTYRNTDKLEQYVLAFLASMVIIVVLLIILACVCAKNIKRLIIVFARTINFVVIFILIVMCSLEFFYELTDGIILSLLLELAITIILYSLVLYKNEKLIFNMIIDLLAIPFIVLLLTEIVEAYVLLFVIIFPLIYAILKSINRNTEKIKFEKLMNISERISKSEILALGSIAIGSIIGQIIIELIDFVVSASLIETLIMFASIICIYLALSKVLGKNDKKSTAKDGKIVIDFSGMDFIGVITGIVLILILIAGVLSITRSFSSNISLEGTVNDSAVFDWSGAEVNTFDSTISSSGFAYDTSSSSSSIIPSISDILDFKSESQITESVIEDIDDDVILENEEEITSKEEENVRNVFLESLAFIPELITENGKASENIKISDNITTWNIQVVGNTKDGNIGYGNASIKVFKEFFIDFSLPTNSVVTDNTSIPVTLYNYTETDQKINLNVVENDWAKIGEYQKEVSVPAQNTTMVYVPIEILKHGNNTLRIEAKSGEVTDIVEKTMEVKPNGLEKANIISTGNMEKKIEQDILFNDDSLISGTEELILRLYPSTMSQVVEGMENILRMPTGCFEQTSSSLYPNILVLEYLENNDLSNESIREKALKYISSGYQRILTFEVLGEKGGYSLYGDTPAETVITAFGLMELEELSNVYDIDENVLDNMLEFLFKNQNLDGSFEYGSTYIGSPSSKDKLAMSAYITWAISESYPDDERLEKSVEYLEKKLDEVNDNYTLALITNVLVNTNSSKKDAALKKLNDKVTVNSEDAYVNSNSRDYYGSYGRTQNIQATALTSIAFTNAKKYEKTNNLLINYIIKQKDRNGTWYSTQSTVLALKALVEYGKDSDISNQEIKIALNGKEQTIKIEEDSLDFYEVKFDNVEKENKLSVEMKKGKITYEIIQNYYVDYEKLGNTTNNNFEIEQKINTNVKVNETISQNLKVKNISSEEITNGLIQISIPQGTSVDEDSLLKLKYNKIIEKYEYGYGKINLYIRNFGKGDEVVLDINYKALYPEKVTGGAIRVYDYYNPETEDILKPVQFTVSN